MMIELSASSHTTSSESEQPNTTNSANTVDEGVDHVSLPIEESRQDDGLDDEFAPLQSLEVNHDRSLPEDRAPTLDYARILLYTSHFFAQFSEGVWQFSLILFLAAVSGYQSLILVSTYGIMSFAAVCLCGSQVGRFVDNANRLFAAQRFIWTENAGVVLASILCFALLAHAPPLPPKPDADASWWERYIYGVPNDWYSILLLVGIHLFGSLAQILDHGFMVAIERDWIVVMSQEHAQPKLWLSATNVTLRQIDLSCKMVAPAVSGFVIGSFRQGEHAQGSADLTGAAILVGVLNVVSLIVEYVCTARIYRLVPNLAWKRESVKTCPESLGTEKKVTERDKGPCRLCCLPRGLRIYFQQSIAWGGLGLAMLYVNALTFGGLMTAFLVWKGMPMQTVGIWRGVSSAMGLFGTIVYHKASKYLSIVQTGQWSIIYLFGCLSLCFASFFVDDYNSSMTMLISGACLSRIGLWVFDISMTQLMQEFVPEDIRGLIGGTQQSINAFFQLLSFSLGLVFPDPRQFYIFATAGYFAIGTAMLLYTVGVGMKSQEFRTDHETDTSTALKSKASASNVDPE